MNKSQCIPKYQILFVKATLNASWKDQVTMITVYDDEYNDSND